ncbi:leucine-rich repeat neuronal protein 3-like [Hetaerina americana]|uniref:leucine-rich repeat neuronal protein 3-like n=1 Tax=Hetaerina americana TaxID=62018 RepID=UPI003A7F599B
MTRLDRHAICVGLLIFCILADSQSYRTKKGICKRCSCEKLNAGPNQTLRLDCSRLEANDVEDLLGYGEDEGHGGAWTLPYEASQDYRIIKIILDANSINHLRRLPPLKEEFPNATRESETGSTVNVTPESVNSTGFDIHGNSTASPSPPSDDFTMLIEVSFRANHVKRIDPGAFAALSNTICSIDLANNDLTYDALPGSVFGGDFSNQRYEPLPNLKKLNLARNMLHSLDAKIFEHISFTLEELNLQWNSLGNSLDTVTEAALSTLTKLKTLNLADVGISSFPEGLAHALISLENLRLDGNKLAVVPTSLSMASSSLLYLNLNRNPITKINATSFVESVHGSAWSKLETLDISAMQELTYVLKGSFENLKGLRTLRCAYNQKLMHFDEEAFRLMGDDEMEWERWKGFQLKEVNTIM